MSAIVSASEKCVSGRANIRCRYACAWEIGSSIEAITVAKSKCVNSFILLKIRGIKSDIIDMNTTPITTMVSDAAAQRGT